MDPVPGSFTPSPKSLHHEQNRIRGGGFDAAVAFARLDALSASWLQVEPSDEIRETARRLLRVHPLRAADALQLAAAYAAAERRPPTMTFVTLDDRLRTAADREGFVVQALPAE